MDNQPGTASAWYAHTRKFQDSSVCRLSSDPGPHYWSAWTLVTRIPDPVAKRPRSTATSPPAHPPTPAPVDLGHPCTGTGSKTPTIRDRAATPSQRRRHPRTLVTRIPEPVAKRPPSAREREPRSYAVAIEARYPRTAAEFTYRLDRFTQSQAEIAKR